VTRSFFYVQNLLAFCNKVHLWYFRVAPLVPEIIPPVTRMVTLSKSSKPLRSKPSGLMQSPTSDTGARSLAGAAWVGGEFTPSSSRNAALSESSRTKRYSSQRLRGGATTADSIGFTDTSHNAATAAIDTGVPVTTSLSTTTPQLVSAPSMVAHIPPARPASLSSSALYGTLCYILMCLQLGAG